MSFPCFSISLSDVQFQKEEDTRIQGEVRNLRRNTRNDIIYNYIQYIQTIFYDTPQKSYTEPGTSDYTFIIFLYEIYKIQSDLITK